MVILNERTRLLALTLLPAVALSLSMGCASAPVSGVQPDGSFRETFEAFAVSIGTSNPPVIPAGTTATVQINITRWTTAEERDALLTQLKENGQEGLVKSLQKQEETGWVMNRSTTTRSATARAAMGTSAPASGFATRGRPTWAEAGAASWRPSTDPSASWRASRQTRWRDYDVTIITLEVDKNGQGEGQLAMGVQLAFEAEGNKLTLENFGSEPVRLNNVRRR